MEETILKMVCVRLNRVYTPTGSGAEYDLTQYLRDRVSAAIQELERAGIYPDGGPADNLFVADYVCWEYANREKQEPMPDWLRLKRWERHMAEKRRRT